MSKHYCRGCGVMVPDVDVDGAAACRETDACVCADCTGAPELVSAAEIHAAAAAAGIVVIGCGAAKLGHRAPAAELYTGPYFGACRMTAERLGPGRWFILSARYGLVRPSEELEPYELTLGQEGAVGAVDVGRQAAELGVLGERVTALCGARYADLLALVFADVRRPLAGLGIGRQRRMLAEIRRAAC